VTNKVVIPLPAYRNVLEQYQVLNFVSSRTLQQLPHLPPHQLKDLDTWLVEDLAEYQARARAAAAAAAEACGRVRPPHSPAPDTSCGPPSSSSSSGRASGIGPEGVVTSWAHSCGAWEAPDPSRWKLPPSAVLEELISQQRLIWKPLGTAAPPPPPAAAAAAAAAGSGWSTAHSGVYEWQAGPVDAFLAGSKEDKQARAEVLQQREHPRNQARLLLKLQPVVGPCSSTHSSSGAAAATQGGPQYGRSAGQPQQQWVCGGCVEWKFFDLSHKSSCHLQRHPVLAAHDRLIRVSVDRNSLALSGEGTAAQKQQQQLAMRLTLEDLLTNGVVVAGRRYQRWGVYESCTAQHNARLHYAHLLTWRPWYECSHCHACNLSHKL